MSKRTREDILQDKLSRALVKRDLARGKLQHATSDLDTAAMLVAEISMEIRLNRILSRTRK